MAITDAGVPAIDPHTMLTTLLTSNMTSPDGVWTPTVNAEWLEFKKQKTYQIAIQPLYSTSTEFNLTGGNSTAEPRISTAFYSIVLFAPTRVKVWSLYQKTMLVLNNQTFTSPQSGGTYAGVASTDYHFVRVIRTEESKAVRISDPDCGPGKTNDSDCVGYRVEITVACRWNE